MFLGGMASVSEEELALWTTVTEICNIGWAFKTSSKRPRLGDNVKRYLIKMFNTGERSGSKVEPLSLSREMKLVKDRNGKFLFRPDEWKSANTIKTFFSRYRAKMREQLGIRCSTRH